MSLKYWLLNLKGRKRTIARIRRLEARLAAERSALQELEDYREQRSFRKAAARLDAGAGALPAAVPAGAPAALPPPAGTAAAPAALPPQSGIVRRPPEALPQKLQPRNRAINLYLAFAQRLGDNAGAARADLYVAHGVEALPAADRLRELTGGRAVCDVIEIPGFSKRALPSAWDPAMLKMIDHALAGYLRDADFLITIGWALGRVLEEMHADVRVVPNYRHYEYFTPNARIREEFGIPPEAQIVLCISTVATGFEGVLQAMALLPENVHLVTVGNFVPKQYSKDVEALRDSLGLKQRVHFRAPVPYEELGAYCAGGDIGLIVRDPAIANNWISLPNRVFDYLASGLPMVAPMMPDIHGFTTERGCGVTIPGLAPEDWAAGIREALGRSGEMRVQAEAVARECTWENLERDGLHETFAQAGSVCFIGFSNLARNNRTMRMAASLVRAGVEVKVASPLAPGDTLPDGVRHVEY